MTTKTNSAKKATNADIIPVAKHAPLAHYTDPDVARKLAAFDELVTTPFVSKKQLFEGGVRFAVLAIAETEIESELRPGVVDSIFTVLIMLEDEVQYTDQKGVLRKHARGERVMVSISRGKLADKRMALLQTFLQTGEVLEGLRIASAPSRHPGFADALYITA